MYASPSPEPYDERLRTLRKSIFHRPPYCSGVVPVPSDELILFYGKDEATLGRIDFNDVSEKSLETLAQCCDPATFGRNDENVFDESYRKAGKLDKTAFAVNLDLEKIGFYEIIRSDLLDGKKADKPIHAELYKLNVYGKGSFFKSHKDTPRGQAMFGSLVIIYPTVHEGGTLTFRDGENQWTFDSAEAIASRNGPSVAYAAFFSDVDHEVTPVRTGNRVTITYNLYFANPAPETAISSPMAISSAFQTELERLLADPTFLPDGGVLGFGFRRIYPVMKKLREKVPLDYLKPYLKGSDADILHACDDLKLNSSIWMVFYDHFTVAVRTAPGIHGTSVYEGGVSWFLCQRRGGKRINSVRTRVYNDSDTNTEDDMDSDPHPGRDYDDYDDYPIAFYVQWVTRPSTVNVSRSSYATYGNEPSIGDTYGRVCLFVEIGKPGKRANGSILLETRGEGKEKGDEGDAGDEGDDEGDD